ncbi:helix-turn-helix transcriptional regulator [Saccharopolyspora sp.]|uniref:helix-turn-helix domain-containing protein n=1 Tax=Saccharopolyspora sp. TaxID=33915 RepID=UPI0025CF41A9|nr:helix-turn-helix transcriptional regulator [Saccharopolyspora sp.]
MRSQSDHATESPDGGDHESSRVNPEENMKRSERLRQLGVGAQLKEMRHNSGMSTRKVAGALGISPASVNRNEIGQRVPGQDEITALCALYGVTGDLKKALLQHAAESADTAAWVEHGRVTDELASLVVLESKAVEITCVSSVLVPGLAQTADYSRLVIDGSPVEPDDIERRVKTRLGRQAILSKPEQPKVKLLLEEGVLRRTLGDPRVWGDQLDHLVTLQRRDNVSIRVVPFSAAVRPAISGFTVYQLGDGAPYIFVETEGAGVFVTDPSEVTPFLTTCQVLDRAALSEGESVEIIRNVAEGVHVESAHLAHQQPIQPDRVR